MFKTTAGHWTCDTCMIQNKSDATKCAACETKKPGAAPPGKDWIWKYVLCIYIKLIFSEIILLLWAFVT